MSDETKITVRLWSVIVVAIGIYGFFFVTAMAHESRLTKVETTLEVSLCNITKSLDKISSQMDAHLEKNK
jgi:hypothetical protein